MVSRSDQQADTVIVVVPNCSATWQDNKRILLLLCLFSLPAAIGFAAIGAWPILPLAGLELSCLGGALYYVNWKLNFRHVIRLSETTVSIEKGHYAPRKRYQFERSETRVAVTPERHPWDGPQLSLQSQGEDVSVGEFLSRDDSLKLLAMLRPELPVGSHAAASLRAF